MSLWVPYLRTGKRVQKRVQKGVQKGPKKDPKWPIWDPYLGVITIHEHILLSTGHNWGTLGTIFGSGKRAQKTRFGGPKMTDLTQKGPKRLFFTYFASFWPLQIGHFGSCSGACARTTLKGREAQKGPKTRDQKGPKRGQKGPKMTQNDPKWPIWTRNDPFWTRKRPLLAVWPGATIWGLF
jgi:hypothetical protein